MRVFDVFVLCTLLWVTFCENDLKRYRNYYIEKQFQIENRIDNENASKYCIQIPIRNIRKLRLTTNVAITLCTTRNLSHDRDVAPHMYIKSGITRFYRITS